MRCLYKILQSVLSCRLRKSLVLTLLSFHPSLVPFPEEDDRVVGVTWGGSDRGEVAVTGLSRGQSKCWLQFKGEVHCGSGFIHGWLQGRNRVEEKGFSMVAGSRSPGEPGTSMYPSGHLSPTP